ncbi:MAG TPA: sigma-70 family RNA polymerase sigma factor [Frankiaceae bacterium]|nr:sigma-70 family RNA polymerase sigma factor [Frankiaceae bacterium]
MLASRGVDPSLNDDIVQEVAVRALDKRVPFTDPDDLYRWAATTARNLHVDHVRGACRITCDEELVLVADATDVAHTAERRVALGHVFRAMAVMRPGERDAILDSLEDREARTSQLLVRRHRARATLRKAVGGVLTAAMVARLRLREVAPALRTASAAAAIAPVLAIGTNGLFVEPAPGAPARVPAAAAPAARAVVRALAARPAAPVVRAEARTARTSTASTRPVRVAEAAPRPTDEEPPVSSSNQVGPVIRETRPNPSGKRSLCVQEDRDVNLWCAPTVREIEPAPDPRP